MGCCRRPRDAPDRARAPASSFLEPVDSAPLRTLVVSGGFIDQDSLRALSPGCSRQDAIASRQGDDHRRRFRFLDVRGREELLMEKAISLLHHASGPVGIGDEFRMAPAERRGSLLVGPKGVLQPGGGVAELIPRIASNVTVLDGSVISPAAF
jgi:hypothetical protein